MKIQDIIKTYKRSDLNRLAKNRIAGYVGWPPDVLREELVKLLSTYEVVKNNVAFRMPPADTILEVIIESEEFRVPIMELKKLVKEKIKLLREEASNNKWMVKDKNYDLYMTLLNAAWSFHDDLDASECNLLAILRDYLGISFREHRLLQASPKIGYFKFHEESFNRELTHLLNSGIILVIDQDYIIPEEIVDKIFGIRGIELQEDDFKRLLGYLSNNELEKILYNNDLFLSGTKEEKISRIIKSEIKPSNILSKVSVSSIREVARKTNLHCYEKKEILIAAFIEHIKNKADLKKEEVFEEELIKPIEERLLTDEAFKELILKFSIAELSQILSKLNDVNKRGHKSEKIENLVASRYAEHILLEYLNMESLRNICKELRLDPYKKKQDLIRDVISYYEHQKEKPTSIRSEALFEIFEEISILQKDAYNKFDEILQPPELMNINVDFKQTTHWAFENILKLNVVKPSTKGSIYDGIIKGDNIILYDCKATLDTPYSLPERHIKQLKKDTINEYDHFNINEKSAFKMILIIANKFSDGFAERMKQLKTDLNIQDIHIGGISSHNLRILALDWKINNPDEIFPSNKLIFENIFIPPSSISDIEEWEKKLKKQKRIKEIETLVSKSVEKNFMDAFSNLKDDEKTIIHILLEHNILSEQDITHFLKNEGYSVSLVKAKMNKLIKILSENNFNVIEVTTSGDENHYLINKEVLSGK